MDERLEEIRSIVEEIRELRSWKKAEKVSVLLGHLAEYGGEGVEHLLLRTARGINDVVVQGRLPRAARRGLEAGRESEDLSYVRVLMNRTRHRLERLYKQSPWRHKEFKLQIHTHERHPEVEEQTVWTLELVPNSQDPSPQAFWRSHTHDERPTRIVISEPVFFRDRADTFCVRMLRSNNPSDGKSIARRFRVRALQPFYNYVSVGEVRGLLAIRDFVGRAHVKLQMPEFSTTEHETWHSITGSNIVLLGPPRANWMTREMQRDIARRCPTGLRLVLAKRSIVKITGQRQRIRLTDDPGSATDRGFVHGVVTRWPIERDRVATAISSNHGVVTEAICKFLTTKAVAGLFDRAEEACGEPRLPGAFQALFTATLHPAGRGAGNVECREFYTLAVEQSGGRPAGKRTLK